MEWIQLIASLFAGVAGGAAYKYYINRRHPFRWRCPESDCYFVAMTNHAEVFEAVIVAHVHDHGIRRGLEE